MASSGKKRTTVAKLNRETRLRTKRAEKAARRAARKLDSSDAVERQDDPGLVERRGQPSIGPLPPEGR